MGKDARNGETSVEDGRDSVVGDGAFFLEENGREDDLGPLDANVFDAWVHGSLASKTPSYRLRKSDSKQKGSLFKISKVAAEPSLGLKTS